MTYKTFITIWKLQMNWWILYKTKKSQILRLFLFWKDIFYAFHSRHYRTCIRTMRVYLPLIFSGKLFSGEMVYVALPISSVSFFREMKPPFPFLWFSKVVFIFDFFCGWLNGAARLERKSFFLWLEWLWKKRLGAEDGNSCPKIKRLYQCRNYNLWWWCL